MINLRFGSERITMPFERRELFRKECGTLEFLGRVSIELGMFPPVRAYFHKTGFDVFRHCGYSNCVNINAETYLRYALDQNLERFQGVDYILAAMWGNKEDKMIDVFTFSDIKEWPGNPDVGAFVLKNDVYVPNQSITCGDTLIVLGLEEAYRRETKSLVDYIHHPPIIKGLSSI